MPPKKRVTTSATKAKLPLPANHPQRAKPKKRVKRFPRKTEAIYTPTEIRDGFGLQACEKCGLAHNVEDYEFCARHTTQPPRAIPCGEDTHAAQDFNGLAVLNTKPTDKTHIWFARSDGATWCNDPTCPECYPNVPPDTSSYPWPLKVLWWLDTPVGELWTRFRTRLAQWVTP